MSPILPPIESSTWLPSLIRELAAAAPIFIAAAAVSGAIIAVLSYRKWHSETTGKRKIELAEEVLARAYRARQAIASARSPLGWGNEGATRKRSEDETPSESQAKDAYYRTVERLLAENEVFTDLRSKKFLAMAYFPSDVAMPFDDLQKLRSSIIMSAQHLIQWYGKPQAQMPAMQLEFMRWEADIGWGAAVVEDDEKERELDRIIAEFERIFGAWLHRPANA
jgi:hypothetical protein